MYYYSMKTHAILWDGFSKIQGELEVNEQSITFHLLDFASTNLAFNIALKDIKKVFLHSLFDLEKIGVEVITNNDKVNVFIVKNPREVKASICNRI